jgi:UDP-glucuronate 4-epimerase
MALFTKAILEGRPIDVFNHRKMERDFTYIDGSVEGVVRVLDKIPTPNPSSDRSAPDIVSSVAPYRLYNIGSDGPVELMTFIETVENATGEEAVMNMLPMEAGHVLATHADIADLRQTVGFGPNTPLKEGVEKFVAWFKTHYGAARSQAEVEKEVKVLSKEFSH